MSENEPRRALVEALAASAAVTVVVSLVSAFVPEKYIATAVGFVFLAATWLLAWRRDDARVERYGLALGGLVMPGKLRFPRLAVATAQALAWAVGLSLIFFVPFFLGWRLWWAPKMTFSLHVAPKDALNEIMGQILVIALPEEAFYRGYLQSRLDEAFPRKVRFLGAQIGLALLIASLIFALGHLATIRQPVRLAVFFPSLVFGWLRARTGGVGASIAFHAMCNLFSETLGRGYGVY
jgi:hypothetical protein